MRTTPRTTGATCRTWTIRPWPIWPVAGWGWRPGGGHLTEALRWARLRDFALRQMRDQQRLSARLSACLAAPVPDDTPAPRPQPAEAPREKDVALLARARDDLQKVHKVHSNSGEAPRLNRTERRRLKRMRKQTGPP